MLNLRFIFPISQSAIEVVDDAWGNLGWWACGVTIQNFKDSGTTSNDSECQRFSDLILPTDVCSWVI